MSGLIDIVWNNFDGLGWLLLMLGPLLFFQRRLHRELQVLFLLITRRPMFSLGLFSLLFFPGVFLHELSHYVMAQLLMVRTGRFSLIPQLMPEGQLRLGYVETAESDLLRDAMIGMSPLISGGAVIAYLGLHQLGLVPLVAYLGNQNWEGFWYALRLLPQQSDFWMWFYLAFAVSSTMLPSASDRRAWLPLTLVILGLIALAFFAGGGPWLLQNLAPALNQAFRLLATIFGVSLVVHLVLLFPLVLLRGLVMQIAGLRVVRVP